MKWPSRMQLAGICAALFVAACVAPSHDAPPPFVQGKSVAAPLRTPADFASIGDRRQRSVALFVEAARVIESPRCLNCHPATRMPTQGEDLHPHVPYLQAGDAGHGLPGLACATCHQASNVPTLSAIPVIPGNEHWALAPASMAWQGRSTAQICAQIKDPQRNGGRSLAQISEHMGKDALVGWAWNPGANRVPAPGTQLVFGALIEAWIATGAACPEA
ncbi:MAG: Isoquinoline 1-oxidoreductase subunit [Steroidobacteraceae bacterium]